jgi:hypothetical protein
MRGQYDLERSWHILNLRMRVERSSLVGRFGSIREVGAPGSADENVRILYKGVKKC